MRRLLLLVPLLLGCGLDPYPPPPPPGFGGLSAPATLRRDALGVVHIYAQSDLDVMFASGWAQARDRLFQMDLMRRRALGKRAAIVGGGAVGEDTFLRLFDITRWGRESAAQMRADDPSGYALVEAWAAGVNRRIDEVTSGEVPLPYGFGPNELDYLPERWTAEDVLVVGKLILFSNANQIQFEVLATVLEQYFGDLNGKLPFFAPLEEAFILPPEERPPALHVGGGGSAGVRRPLPDDAADRFRDFFAKLDFVQPRGSNNWAVDGSHTVNGRPMVAGDPHQQLESPSLMWAQHMNSYDAGGTFDAVGFSFVGSPGVQLGHSRWLAWTATTNYPDVMDIWDVEVTGSEVVFAGEHLPIVVRNEQLEVRDADPVDIVAEEVPGVGVLLPADLSPVPLVGSGHRMLLGWTGFGPTREAQVFVSMNDAHTIEAFEAAADQMEIGNFNFVLASADGISYRSGALVPDRGPLDDAHAPFKLRDGADPGARWLATPLGPDKLPHSRGGTRGWIASANNDPFGFTADGRIAGDPWYYGWFFDPGTRSGRVEAELARLVAEGPVDVAQMQALQTDSYSLLADELLPPLFAAWATVPSDDALARWRNRPDLQALVDSLAAWDRRMTRPQAQPVSFTAFAWFLARGVLSDDLPALFDAVADESPIYALKVLALTVSEKYPAALELMQEGKSLLLVQALDAASAFLVTRFGSTDPAAYSWADYHATHFSSMWGAELDGGSIPTDGSSGTVNVSDTSFFAGETPVERLESGAGAIYRMVTSFDDDGVPRATVSFPRGNSGDPKSPYWDNTLEDWANGVYQPLLFRADEVAAGAKEEFVLEP